MAKFVTIGYGDRAGYEQITEDQRSAAHSRDRELQVAGALMGIAGKPIQVRNTGGVELKIQPGAFMSSELPIAGFAIIEASDISEAIRMVAGTPCAVAHGVVEVWPLEVGGQ